MSILSHLEQTRTSCDSVEHVSIRDSQSRLRRCPNWPDEPQRSAVEHGEGDPQGPEPLLIIAGAGAGKTHTLAHRLIHLMLNGADPKRIMLVTFSRRAASELTARSTLVA